MGDFFEIVEDLGEKGQRPFTVEETVGTALVGGFQFEPRFGALPIEGQGCHPTAALLSGGVFPLADDPVVEGGKQKRTEAALGAVDVPERVLLKD